MVAERSRMSINSFFYTEWSEWPWNNANVAQWLKPIFILLEKSPEKRNRSELLSVSHQLIDQRILRRSFRLQGYSTLNKMFQSILRYACTYKNDLRVLVALIAMNVCFASVSQLFALVHARLDDMTHRRVWQFYLCTSMPFTVQPFEAKPSEMMTTAGCLQR